MWITLWKVLFFNTLKTLDFFKKNIIPFKVLINKVF